jgi:hypothetical protein
VRQISLPSLASSAASQPRVPLSPRLWPMMYRRHQRGGGELLGDVEFVPARHLLVEHELAGVAVDRDHPPVEQVGDHGVAPDGEAAVARRGVRRAVEARIGRPLDQTLARIARVDLVDRAEAVGDEHHAVVDDRRALDIDGACGPPVPPMPTA